VVVAAGVVAPLPAAAVPAPPAAVAGVSAPLVATAGERVPAPPAGVAPAIGVDPPPPAQPTSHGSAPIRSERRVTTGPTLPDRATPVKSTRRLDEIHVTCLHVVQEV
jgi:hypothetical protein